MTYFAVFVELKVCDDERSKDLVVACGLLSHYNNGTKIVSPIMSKLRVFFTQVEVVK